MITSPAIARLMKAYKHYVMDCISDTKPIVDIDTFYKHMVRIKEMNKSRIYEKYRVKLSQEELSGKTEND